MSKNTEHQEDRTLRAMDVARIHWQTPFPRSDRFDDIYFSTTNGREESRHVFIDANQLGERWAVLPDDSAFTIIETGFGTGLNFLCAAQLWAERAPATGQLEYLSIEKYPLSRADLARSLEPWDEFGEPATQLIDSYPPPLPGFHRLPIKLRNHPRPIVLTLIFAEAREALRQLQSTGHPALAQHRFFTVDAWFLDGFAPAKNPDLWTPEIFKAMSQLSHVGTSLSTFTASGQVRRGLSAVGFEMKKIPGFGSKREMLAGSYSGQTATAETQAASEQPGPQARRKQQPDLPWHIDRARTAQTPASRSRIAKQAAIIGAGIAGCTTARALADRGWQVTIYDRHGRPGAEASGNPQGIIYPRLSTQAAYLSRFNLAGLLFASRFYQPFWKGNSGSEPAGPGQSSGVLVLPEKAADAETFKRIADNCKGCEGFVRLLEGSALEQISGIKLAAKIGLYFPGLGWIKPLAVCRQLVNHPGITVETATITALEQDADPGHWRLQSSTGTHTATTVVLAASNNSRAFELSRHLPLKPIRGQISMAPAGRQSQALNTVVCGAGYLAPADEQLNHSFGASYNLDKLSTEVCPLDHQRNIDTLIETDPTLHPLLGQVQPGELEGRAALRCSSPDYLPLVGPLPVFEDFIENYAELKRDARADIPLPGSYWPGLYVHCGLGSRGFTYAPLGAEILAAYICAEAPVLPNDLLKALHPARFIIRDLKRKRI